MLKNRKRELAVLNNGREFPTVPGMSGSVALVTNTTSENLSPSSASADTCHDVEYPPAREHPRDLDLGNVPDSDVSTSSDSDRSEMKTGFYIVCKTGCNRKRYLTPISSLLTG